ncbi:hypothetical protein TNIN_423261 [Trichonephila inaurata madagascariensis]|uniref:Secreted protein n=1 Tax=Trichonephila inaurata madagascariensis TaxID=2747483 RepID=A0A8X6XL19_9ARAC|nr:hypothetical protein TNIN_423261 [Trichonephila inaurata madagascariensis]
MGVLLWIIHSVLCHLVSGVVNLENSHRSNTSMGSLVVLGGAEIERKTWARGKKPGQWGNVPPPNPDRGKGGFQGPKCPVTPLSPQNLL